jgi:hypothetical protein
MYVPSKLIFWDNPEKTVENIRQSEELFPLGIVSGIIFSCLIDFLGSFPFINYSKSALPSFIHFPSAIGEFGICLWRLVMSARPIRSTRKKISREIVACGEPSCIQVAKY